MAKARVGIAEIVDRRIHALGVCAATGMLGIAMYDSFHDSVRGPRTTDGVES